MSPNNEHSPEDWFHLRAGLYVETLALYHLNKVGVLEWLDQNTFGTSEDIAAALNLNQGVLDSLMSYIAGIDTIIAHDNDRGFYFTTFGRTVIDRYSRSGPEGRVINMFDVRAGGYGPVWNNLDGLLSGDLTYGVDIKRAGERAAQGLYKAGASIAPGLTETIGNTRVEQIVELGVISGLLGRLQSALPERSFVGVDRKKEELERAQEQLPDPGERSINWVCADVFEVSTWAKSLKHDGPGLIFSVHFHEFLAQGDAAMRHLIKQLRASLPGWKLLVVEQPQPSAKDPQNQRVSDQMYAHANVLIHHLIGNGRILSVDDWIKLFEDEGCTLDTKCDANFLGYFHFLFSL